MTVGLLTGILGLAVSLFPLGLDLEENIGMGLLFRLRGPRTTPSDVIVVALDKVSADNLNLPMDPEKWPRSLHARLTKNLAKEGAAVIAFDIIFDEARSADHDNLFAEAISTAGNVVLCECLKREIVPLTDEQGTRTGDLNIERLVSPIPLLARAAAALAPFPLPKVPVKLSQYWTFKTGAGDKPTLPVVAFQIFALGVYEDLIRSLEKVSPSQAVKLPSDKDTIVTSKSVEKLVRDLKDIFQKKPLIAEKILKQLGDSRTGSIGVKENQMLRSLIRMYQSPRSRYLNFYGPPRAITTVPYYQVLQLGEKSDVYQRELSFTGKAVFVGLSESLQPEQKEGFYTAFSQPTGLDISGVEIAATAFANLLEDMPIKPRGFGAHLATILLWGAVLGIFCRLFPTSIAAGSVVGMSILYLIVVKQQFTNTGSWYPLVIPLFFQVPLAFFGAVFWKYCDTNRERRNIREKLGYFLPDTVVDQLAKGMADIKSNAQVVYGTCLCTDAEQYTTLSETMGPGELTSFMNQYYEVIFKPVKEHDGIISDVKGDSMLAIWATTHPDAALRSQACFAALDIANAVNRFKESYDTLQLPTRIGLHSGHMMLGTVGAIDHYEYRPVGDMVNTASRIEGLNKYLGTRILVSEEVLHELEGFLTRELGEFLLVGKSQPIAIYELICRMEESNEAQRNLCSMYAEALSAYRSQCWEEAITILNEFMKNRGGDGPSIFFAKLCENHRKKPPGEKWNGLVRVDTK
jgi:adenylate cyclase